MSEKRRASCPFLQSYLNGEACAENIDDFIDAWHAKPGRKKIFEFLGMTDEEYSLWLCDPDSLPEIARARRANLPLTGIVKDTLVAMRATGEPREKHLRRWLAQQTEAHPAK
jgi:hypothetical protein